MFKYIFGQNSSMAFLGLDEKGQSEWSSIYLLIVFAIAALLMIALVKPMFQQSQKIVEQEILN